jgi:hypothetical protein
VIVTGSSLAFSTFFLLLLLLLFLLFLNPNPNPIPFSMTTQHRAQGRGEGGEGAVGLGSMYILESTLNTNFSRWFDVGLNHIANTHFNHISKPHFKTTFTILQGYATNRYKCYSSYLTPFSGCLAHCRHQPVVELKACISYEISRYFI